jgi:acyl dehydratase
LAVELSSLEQLRDRVGQELAVSNWIEISQARIDRFAEVTDDAQWIHVDPARAARESPFGTTVAHGFLTLSLCTALARDAMALPRSAMAVNYGLNRVRFISPVPAGSRVRARFTPVEIEETGQGAQVTWNVVIEREGGDRPCCVAEWIVRYSFRV